ncbi:hypothetical protein HOLleu_09575 [Holothuria leucospilota]|uniref:Rhodanese domain-containing protein n=1 Tax=Holothuria leucospilota TaxID=206669 RepID=A0A9Q1HB48_HOLLE|nr:hypothetical protein HOLleu_09575 [Holothuria leucospilota]
MQRLVFYKYFCSAISRPIGRPNTSSVLVSPQFVNHFTRMGIKTGVVNEQQKASPSVGMNMTISALKKQFPKVKTIDTNTLAQWIDEDKGGISFSNAKDGKDLEQVKQSRNLVILDVRLEEEAAVSKIPYSTRVDPDEKDMKKLKEIIEEKSLSKGQDNDPVSVVMYCAVGYRASNLVSRFQQSLQKEGNQDSMNVYNLEGSIFKWANENRSLVNLSGEPTGFVHPYSTMFGKLYLDSSRTKFTP